MMTRDLVRVVYSCLAVATVGVMAVGAQAPQTATGSPLQNSRQVLLVITNDWDAVPGTMQRFERAKSGGAWKPVGASFALVVGKNGLGWGRGVRAETAGGPIKKEGDGKSPAGVYELGRAFGQSPKKLAGLRVPYLFLNNNVECVDDAQSKYYNQLVTKHQAGEPDWNSSEKMWEEPLYRWGLVVRHNTPAEAGGGSCIFLHIWRAPDRGTAGCTAMDESNLVATLKWLDPKKNPVLVQLPRSEYERLKAEWRLP